MTQVKTLLKALVTTSIVLGAFACTDAKTVEEYQAEAQSFIDKNDNKSAIIALKNANALEQNSASLRFQLGLLYLQQGDYLSAEKELERSLLLGFDKEKVLPELIEAKYKLSKFDDVYALIEDVTKLPDSAQIKALTYAGLSALAQQKRSKAIEYIDQANSTTGESVYGQLGKAYLVTTKEEINEALILVNSLIAYAPEITESYLLKGYLLQSTKEYIESVKAFQQYAKLRPREIQVQFFIAQNYISAKAFDKAEPIVDALLKHLENNPLANQMKAQISFQKKDYELAKRFGEKAYQLNRSLSLSAVIAGMSAYYSEDYQQAYNLLVKVDDLAGSIQQSVDKVLVELQLRLGYSSDAIKNINELISSGDADTALLTAASSKLLEIGNKTAAKELLEESIKLNTDSVDDVINQGILKLKLDDVSGIETLEKALTLDPNSTKAESGLAIGYLNNQQYDEALVIAKKWQNDEIYKVQGLFLEAEIANLKNNADASNKLIYQVLELEPNNVSALFKLAVYHHKAEDYANAFNYYQQIINIEPFHENATRGIVTASYSNSDFANLAIQLYQEKINQSPDNKLKLNQAYVYVANNESEKALSILLTLKSTDANNAGYIDLVIGDLLVKKEERKKASQYYSTVTNKRPKSLTASTKLYTNFLRVGDVKSALKEVKRIASIYPDNLGLLLTKVDLQSSLDIKPKSKDIDVLLEHPKSKEHWMLIRTLGRIAYLNGDIKLATEHFQEAYDKNPTDNNVARLSKSLGRSESVEAVVELLEKHLTKVNSSHIKALLANAYLHLENLSKAEGLYLDILKEAPNDVLVLNNLSYVHHELNKQESALNYAERAIAIAPEITAVIDTYAQALLLNEKPMLAIEQADKILAISPNDIDAVIHKANAYIQLENLSKARELLESIDVNDNKTKIKVDSLLNTIK